MIEQTLVVQTSPDYSAGDLVGGLLHIGGIAGEVPGSGVPLGGGLIQSVVITDLAILSIDKDIVFFDANPAATTFTENGALDIDDADLPKVIGTASLTSWVLFGDNAVSQVLNLGIPFADTPLLAAIIERGTANYVSTADLKLRVGILPQ